MRFRSVPSLQSIAQIEIAAALWNRDVSCFTKKVQSYYLVRRPRSLTETRENSYSDVENAVIARISKLPIPPFFEKELCRYVRVLGWELVVWLDFHIYVNKLVSKVPNKIYWTQQGLVDKRKTAAVLVNDESLDLSMRYKFACLYCLDGQIDALWKRICIGKNVIDNLSKEAVNKNPLVSFWSHYVARKLERLYPVMRLHCERGSFSPCEYAFRRSVTSGNEAATRFFFSKLTDEEKEWLIPICATELVVSICTQQETAITVKYKTDVLCFLFQFTSKELQRTLLSENSCKMLLRLLDWPWQTFFMDAVESMWDLIPDELFHDMLKKIAAKQCAGFSDYDYHQLFRELWQKSPEIYKNYIINDQRSDCLLSYLFQEGFQVYIAMILSDVSQERKEQMILSAEGIVYCARLMLNQDWVLLKFYISECVSSRETASELKRKLELLHLGNNSRDILLDVLRFLDCHIQCIRSKRGLDCAETSTAKRFRSL